ncbi:glutathione peroxidase [Bacillus sp. HMF5848]|uniref:glutathione peroxidase n=1 Tax=Bacillus sp. HMF5848 TaxID=2495421 RepID=UPI000F76F7CC|nr:glutathione peroxidase [Bacillus sp. HMF5848]RSK27691.1 glutathione peroxidase [Bacillus sp. HMF5848]
MKNARLYFYIAFSFLVIVTSCGVKDKEVVKVSADTPFYSYSVKTVDGIEKSLSEFKGNVLVIVNTASKCGYTPQYEELQTLYETYNKDGLEVLAFPSNDYGAQEPGTNAEIKEFCQVNYGVTFPIFEKIYTRGDSIHPLYAWLTKNAEPKGEISWNFEKFVIDQNGEIVARYKSNVSPMNSELEETVKSLLNN